MAHPTRVILGSRSPQRLELLRQVVPAGSIEVVPPRSATEAGFDNLHDWPAIEKRLVEIARAKCADVQDQVAARAGTGAGGRTSRDPASAAVSAVVIVADSVIVVRGADGVLRVLGQPPDDSSWCDAVRSWFRTYYAGRIHWAATAFCVAKPGSAVVCRVVRTEVSFRDDVDRWLDWYIATEEPRGKAGGYAIQGAGGLFVTRVVGSISNVVGLPLAELFEILGG